jgi:radical SAM superfamily enzyme YgiQ (UPF0313 family)
MKQVKVIGIIPKYPPHSQHNIFARILMPPVGIISVLTQIKDRADCMAIDENNYGGPVAAGMPDHSFLRPCDLALFYGGMSNSIPRLFQLARDYKASGAITVAGGSHVDAMAEEAITNGVDIVVHGEGEETMKEILNAIKEHALDFSMLKRIKGISFKDADGKIIRTGQREHITDLDLLADPDLTLIRFLRKRWSAIPINRGRGCNWNCEFCIVNKQYGKSKAKSVSNAMRQIITYSDLGYKNFFFTDDNFAQNPAEAIELCDMIAAYRRQFRKDIGFTVQVRNEVAENIKLVTAMKEAGVHTLAIGFESPINEELTAMKKGVTVERLVRRSRRLSQLFYIHGMFIFGYPAERHVGSLTLEERAQAYKRFFRQARIDTIQVLNAVPLPGSYLRTRLESQGRLLSSTGWDKYDGQFLCYDPTPDGYDPVELQEIPRRLMKEWYLGNTIIAYINYGNWANWAYLATIGFPIQFSAHYVKRLVSDMLEGRFSAVTFRKSLNSTWHQIKRSWRNTLIRTYGGQTVRRWMREYRKSRYHVTLEKLARKHARRHLSLQDQRKIQ